jgi:protein N-terminal amidase
MAWLRSDETDGDISTLHAYWLTRLRPLLDRPGAPLAVVCNRTGTERGVTFAGGSCVLSLATTAVLGHLDDTTEGVLIVAVPSPTPA